MERKSSQTRFVPNRSNSQLNKPKDPPSRNNSFSGGNSLMQMPSPKQKPQPQTPISLIVQLIRMIVRKLQDIEQTLSAGESRKRGGTLISIKQKSIEYQPLQKTQFDSQELPRFDLLLEKLESLNMTVSPIRPMKGVSPTSNAYEEMELKLMISQHVKPIKEDVEHIRTKITEMEREIAETVGGFEEELINVITALKNSASMRVQKGRG